MSEAAAEAVPDSAGSVFGDRLDLAVRYHDLLASASSIRGLNGPRELPVLWDRHILNSALLAYLPPSKLQSGATVCDIGSGAGLPGIPLAIARPDLTVTLVDSLRRRTDFLSEVISDLGLSNARVVWGHIGDPAVTRAVGTHDVVTSRAVAPLGRLIGLSTHFLDRGGLIAAMKGRRAEEEIDSLTRKEAAQVTGIEVTDIASPDNLHTARVVLARRA